MFRLCVQILAFEIAEMMISRSLLSPLSAVLLLSLLVLYANAELELYNAGHIDDPLSFVKVLNDGDSICVDQHASGINIRCTGAEKDTTAFFKVNGQRFTKQSFAPFFIAGDKNGNIKPWHSIPIGTVTIECRLTSQTFSVKVNIIQSCPQISLSPSIASPSLSPSSTASPSSVSYSETPSRKHGIFVRSIGLIPPRYFPIRHKSSFCPVDVVGTTKFTVECFGSSSGTRATFRGSEGTRRFDKVKPFTISEDDENGKPAPWIPKSNQEFSIRCRLNNGEVYRASGLSVSCAVPTPSMTITPSHIISPTWSFAHSPSVSSHGESPSPSPSFSTDKENGGPLSESQLEIGCNIIGVDHTKISEGWKKVNGGLAYLPNSSATSITPKGKASLYFNFTAKKTGRHAFVVDLTTSHKADHNDIWIWMEGGFQLLRDVGIPPKKEIGWIKAYQKLSGRGVAIVSGDHDPHSVSTWEILQEGKTYSFGIGGRSTKVTIHRSLFFVCEGDQCLRWKYRQLQDTCIPGSFPRRQ